MNSINKYILLLFSFLFFVGNVHPQNTAIDSLKNELSIHKEKDTTRVNLLYALAFSHFQKDMSLTNTYMAEAETISNNLNYTKGKAKVLYLKGILESRKSDYATSLIFFKRSLKHYESIQNQSGIAAIYNAFGITHFVQSEYEEAINYYEKSSKIHEGLGNTKELINNLISIANVYTETGRYDEAVLNYKKAIKHYELINDKEGIAFVHSNLGVLYKSQGNYSLAIDYYNRGLDYNKKRGDTLGMASSLNNLGDAYNSMRKDNKALEYHKQSLRLSSQKGNKSLVAINNGNIANIYIRKKEYEKALKYYSASLEISREINNVKQTSICFYNLGEINLLLNKYLIAREYFIEAKDISQKINYKYVLSVSYLGIAETFLNEKQYPKALSYTMKGKEIADKLTLLNHQKKSAELLSTIYSKIGDYKKAFESHQQYKLLNDSLFNEENIEKITQLEYEYKYKQALDSADIRELKLTKAVATTNKNLEKSQRNYLWAIIAFLLVSILLGFIIFYQKFRNIKSETQNIVIEQKLLRSQMTPHFIFNSLSVLQGMILNNEEKKAVSYLSKFSKLLRITLENSRDKIVPLSQELTAVDNYLMLQNLENESYKYTVSIGDALDKTLFKIPPMLIQPFVENAIEHAFGNQKEDRTIDVHLKYSNKELVCTIADNGIGIDSKKENKNPNKKSLSTTITSERLRILSKDFNMKGSVSIDDRQKYSEQGTLVTLVIPYKIQVA